MTVALLHTIGNLLSQTTNDPFTQKHLQELDPKFDDRFYRMWNFYKFAGMGAARARKAELWQFVFSKRTSLREYQIAR